VAARIHLAEEGLEFVRDLEDVEAEYLNQAFKKIASNVAPIQGIAEVLNPDGTVLFQAIPPI